MLAYPIRLNVLSHKVGQLRCGPNILAYWERVAARPAYKRGYERMKAEEAKVMSAKL